MEVFSYLLSGTWRVQSADQVGGKGTKDGAVRTEPRPGKPKQGGWGLEGKSLKAHKANSFCGIRNYPTECNMASRKIVFMRVW